MKAPLWEKQPFQHLAPAPIMRDKLYVCVIALSPSFPFCLSLCLSETGSYCVYSSLVWGEAGLKIKTILFGLLKCWSWASTFFSILFIKYKELGFEKWVFGGGRSMMGWISVSP